MICLFQFENNMNMDLNVLVLLNQFPEIKKKYPKEKNVITFEDAFNKYIPKFIPKKN